MIEKIKGISIWGPHISIIAAYAASYQVLRECSCAYWMLPAGMRLCCLLLVPRRFWLAIAIGDFIPLIQLGLMNADRFGMTWGLLVSIPPVMLCMPFMWVLQHRMALFNDAGRVNLSMIMLASIICAMVNTANNAFCLSTAIVPAGSHDADVTLKGTAYWLLGYYLGALTIAPFVLLLHDRMKRSHRSSHITDTAHRSLIRDVIFLQIPIAAVLVMATHLVDADGRVYCRMAMIAPVVLFSRRYGWQGTAMAGMIASFAMAASSTMDIDPPLFFDLAILAVVMSMYLLCANGRNNGAHSHTAAKASYGSALPVDRYAENPRNAIATARRSLPDFISLVLWTISGKATSVPPEKAGLPA